MTIQKFFIKMLYFIIIIHLPKTYCFDIFNISIYSSSLLSNLLFCDFHCTYSHPKLSLFCFLF